MDNMNADVKSFVEAISTIMRSSRMEREAARRRLLRDLQCQMKAIEHSEREQARQLLGDMTEEDLELRVLNNIHYLKLLSLMEFHQSTGKPVRKWGKAWQELILKTSNRLDFRDPFQLHFERFEFPFSDQKAMFNSFVCMSVSHISLFLRRILSKDAVETTFGNRFVAARHFLFDGATWAQRAMSVVSLLWEVAIPLLYLFNLTCAVCLRVFAETGIRVNPFHFVGAVSRTGLMGRGNLALAENGYTKVFRGGDVVSIDELEAELMIRNDELSHNQRTTATTISISYKHYANENIILGDDHRICRTDLQAIAQLINEAGPGLVRFWIDTKLPPTTDNTFERWLNRGVRPYGRYVTFLCPSALQYADSSFWLANEYHFAVTSKGVLYPKDDQIFFKQKLGHEQFELNRRFLRVLVQAEQHPVHVREEDKGKVVHWAMCCLRSGDREVGSELSPSIDNLTMVDDGILPHRVRLAMIISKLIGTFGHQELPVVPGKSWNKRNPLLLSDVPDQGFEFPDWHGMSHAESPEIVYFVYRSLLMDIEYETVVVLEVTLRKPHFVSGRNRVLRKVLKELESNVLAQCYFVALPWLCDWE